MTEFSGVWAYTPGLGLEPQQGTFIDPSEAVFVILGEHEELEPHSDLRKELLKRRLQSAIDDPRPDIPTEEIFEKMRAMFDKPLPEPAKWQRQHGEIGYGLAVECNRDWRGRCDGT